MTDGEEGRTAIPSPWRAPRRTLGRRRRHGLWVGGAGMDSLIKKGSSRMYCMKKGCPEDSLQIDVGAGNIVLEVCAGHGREWILDPERVDLQRAVALADAHASGLLLRMKGNDLAATLTCLLAEAVKSREAAAAKLAARALEWLAVPAAEDGEHAEDRAKGAAAPAPGEGSP